MPAMPPTYRRFDVSRAPLERPVDVDVLLDALAHADALLEAARTYPDTTRLTSWLRLHEYQRPTCGTLI